MTLVFFLDFPQAFTSFVDKTVSLYTGSKLEKFDVSFRYYNSFSSVQPDEWIRFATTPHVEKFLWILLILQYHMSMIKLVQRFELRILDLKFCDFQPFVCVSWPKLNVLTIGYVNQSNEIIAQSLSDSPMLEFLRLQRCNGINRLIVISSNFKELLIDGPRERFSSTWFVMAILTPN